MLNKIPGDWKIFFYTFFCLFAYNYIYKTKGPNNKEMTGGGEFLYSNSELKMIINIALSSNPQYLLNLTMH